MKPPPTETRFHYLATIRDVVDGDTIHVDIHLGFRITLESVRCRLLDVHAPEMRVSNHPSERQDAKAVHSFLQGLLPPGEKVVIENPRGSSDIYGRPLVRVWKGTQDIGFSVASWMSEHGIKEGK